MALYRNPRGWLLCDSEMELRTSPSPHHDPPHILPTLCSGKQDHGSTLYPISFRPENLGISMPAVWEQDQHPSTASASINPSITPYITSINYFITSVGSTS